MLQRQDGKWLGKTRIYRLHREEGLTVREASGSLRCRGYASTDPRGGEGERMLVVGLRARPAYGRRFRILNVVDDVTPECLAAIPRTSSCIIPVAREL